MAPRSRRAWSAIRTEIRLILRETTSSTSFWSDTVLLDAANRIQDRYVMLLADQGDGWFTEAYKDDTVADQREYAIPEGTDRIRRVARVFNPGTADEYEQVLVRHEQYSGTLGVGSTSTVVGRAGMPTYRMMGEYLMIEPPFGESVTNGLRIEIEAPPARFGADGDELNLKWPGVFESLLVYEVVLECFAIEMTQGAISGDVVDHIARIRAEYRQQFDAYVARRTHGRIFSTPYDLGD